MIVMAALMIGIGIVFIVGPRYVTHSSHRRITDRATSRWVGYSLIIMSCLFLIMCIIQLLDQSTHHIGH
ncbi:hypothetical protein [Paenibacillus sp.]